jgi:hypothetical protein
MAIVTHTFISKSNTIIKDSVASVGLNPILELNYGKMLTRGLIYFDHTKVQKMVEDKIYPDISKLRHVLKMKNAGSIDDKHINRIYLDSNGDYYKQRTSSFDLIYFLIPNDWDEGKGFDYKQDLNLRNYRAYSWRGCNWYQYQTYCKWENEGIYSTDKLSKELDLFTSKNGNQSNIIIGYQHFDKGNESIEFDITETFNKFITGELCNYGIGIAFSPQYENKNTELTQYVGFFTSHTHSFFEPYVETTYNETIEDDRADFYLDKSNKLYFYSIVGGKYANLDEFPTCTVDDISYEVKQATKGVYYIDIEVPSSSYEDNTMLYDVWSNIKYKGKSFPNVELEFVTKSSNDYYQFGIPSSKQETELIPTLYGIKYKEVIKRGDIRKINVDCRIPYTTDQDRNNNYIEYRLYILSGEKQIDVIDWQKIEKGYNENYFFINTNELLPSRYYIDIRINVNMELFNYQKVLEFDIADNITEYYN